jgi:hypothetical protein
MQPQDVTRVLSDPLAQELMQSSIPARLAYLGPDGFPRAIPIGFHWNGNSVCALYGSARAQGFGTENKSEGGIHR